MNLAYSAEQEELIAAVRRFCSERVTPERLGEWDRQPNGVDGAFWSEVSRLGWFGLGVPATAGGSGRGLVEVACLLAECSRGLVPTAVISAIRGTWALAQVDPEAAELAALAGGSRRLALAIDEERASQAGALRAAIEGDPPRLHGAKWYVVHGDTADLLLVAARDGEGLSLALADGSQARRSPLRGFCSGEAQAVVHFDGTPARRLTDASAGAAALLRLQRQQVVLALAEMIGGMEALLERTVAYVKEREQFGQKIAVFQAVQHQVADMATVYTASRHLAWQAITRVAEDRDESIDLPAAAAFVGQSFKRMAFSAHHLHGGAGYVVEHPLHRYSERAQSLCIRHTPEGAALESVAAALLD